MQELADKPNVILFLSEEYTGPLEFVQFWLDVVAEWKAETKKNVHIALCATKDVTDAVLNDEKRAAVVSLIDDRAAGGGWYYQPNGTLYAPQAGQNLSPRQWARLLKPKRRAVDEVVKTVREYRSNTQTSRSSTMERNHWLGCTPGGRIAARLAKDDRS